MQVASGISVLGNNITEVYKNGQLISSRMAGVGKEASEIDRANALYKQRLETMREIIRLEKERNAVSDSGDKAV